MNFLHNLKFLRNKSGLTQSELADKIGYKRTVYKDYEYGKEPDIELLVKLSDFFGSTIDDLLRKDLSTNGIPTSIHDQFKVLAITVDEEGRENIEFVPIKARAGYLAGYGNPDFIRELQRFRLPSIPVGTYRAFEISGDSMLPMTPGSVVIGKYVENLKDIKNLYTYVLVTREEGIVYKRVINKIKDKGKLILLSDNANYDPYYIDAKDVVEVWSYYAHMSFNTGQNQGANHKMIEKLLEMDEDIPNIGNILQKYM